jgi:hypothetical protein
VHKFPVLRDGVNEKLLEKVRKNVDTCLSALFDEEDLVRMDGMTSFPFGSATIHVTVVPWHSKDVLVKVFSYLADSVKTKKAAIEFLRLNSDAPLGAFSMAFDNSVIFSCSLPGANLDKSELIGALQTVAAYADQYDDIIREMYR